MSGCYSCQGSRGHPLSTTVLEDTYIFFYYCIFIMFSRFIQGCSMCQYFIPFFHLFTYFIFCHPGSSLRLRLFSICSEQDCSSLKCLDLSLQWLLLFRSTGSRHMDCSSCGSQTREHRLGIEAHGLAAPRQAGSSWIRD